MANSKENSTLPIQVIPNASVNAIVGWHNSFVKIRLQAPPLDGKANKALIRFLSKASGISKNQISIVRGETSRQKWVAFAGITHTDLLQRLELPLEI